MTSVWSFLWVVCGLAVWFGHTHTASVSPVLLRTTLEPIDDERSINPDLQTEPADPPRNNKASVSPSLLMPNSNPITDQQSVNPEHQTEPTDLFISNDTASVIPSQLMPTSDPTTDQQLVIPDQTEPTDLFISNDTASVSPSPLMPNPDPTTDQQSVNTKHQTEPSDLFSSNDTASVSPSLLMPNPDPTTDQQSVNPKQQTGPTDLFSSKDTASVSPSLLMPTSDPTTDQQSVNPEHQTEPTDLFSSKDTASVSSILLMTTSDASTEAQSTTPKHQDDSRDPPSNNKTGRACMSVLPPRRGSYYVEHGTGVSVGSMLVFWCKEGYQLVGHEKIICILQAGVPRWSSYLPVCESIPRPNDQGLRIALLVSVVSGVVILVMTVCFIVCCCQEHMSKKKEKHRMGRSRRRETRSSRSRRSPSWLEREHIDWEAFPPPKLFSLSQRLDRPLPPGSPAYSDVSRAYENRGYERSQESLLRSPRTTYPSYHANSQIYPALVFQRVQTEPNPSTSSTTPVYVQISTPPKNKTPHAPSVTHP